MSKVPEGWVAEQLGNIATFRNGLNFTKSDSGELIKIVGVGDFKDFSELRSTEHLELVNVANTVRNDDLLEDDDLLFVRSNGNKDLIGRCLYFPNVAERISFSGFTIRGRVVKEKILPKYASYLVRSDFVRQQISENGGGTNISNLSQQILNDITFGLPPLAEQQKIAKTLSTWDKAISVTEQLISNSQQQKKALMQGLLTGAKRLPGFMGEWKKAKLGFCTKVIGGYAFKSSMFTETGIPVLRISNIKSNFTINLENCVYYKNIKVNDSFKVLNGDIVIAMSGATTGKVGRYNSNTLCYLNQRVGKFKIDNALVFSDFIFQLLKLPYVQSEIIIDATGGAQPNISNSDIEKIKIILPPLEEQQKIAQVLTAADREIELLQQKLAGLKQEKQALMQQLLTGKRRVAL